MLCPPRTWLSYDQGNGGSYYSRLPRGNRYPQSFYQQYSGTKLVGMLSKKMAEIDREKATASPKGQSTKLYTRGTQLL